MYPTGPQVWGGHPVCEDHGHPVCEDHGHPGTQHTLTPYTDIHRHTQTYTDTHRHTQTHTDTHRHRHTDTDTHTHTHTLFPDHVTFREKDAKLACADKLGVCLSLTLCNKANIDPLQQVKHDGPGKNVKHE